MKLQQTDSTITIKQSGYGQVVGGIVLTAVGIAVAIALGSGFLKDNSGKAAPAWTAVFGILMIVIGVCIILFAKNRTIVLNKAGTSTVTDKRIIGGSTSQQTFETAPVAAVQLQTYIDHTSNADTGKSTNQRRSELNLQLVGNDKIVVADEANKNMQLSIMGMDATQLIQKAPLGKEAHQIADFLQVPLDTQDNTNLATAVKSVVDAFRKPQPAPPNYPQGPPSAS